MNKLVTNQKLRLLAGSITSDGNASPAGTITWKINPLSIGFKNVVSFLINYILTYRIVQSMVSSNNYWMAKCGMFTGGSVGFSSDTLSVINRNGKSMGHIRGNATNFTLTGNPSNWTTVTNNVAEFHFTPNNLYAPNTATQNLGIQKNAYAKYVGTTANRRVISITPTGGAKWAFRLIDTTTGLAVGANSTTDIIEIGINQGVGASFTTANSSGGSPGNNVFRAEAKINLIGILEL